VETPVVTKLGPAVLVGAAVALSSTILVYKALEEFGQTETPRGRRAIMILLFQDAALVRLMLLVPLLTGTGQRPSAGARLLPPHKQVFLSLHQLQRVAEAAAYGRVQSKERLIGAVDRPVGFWVVM
jgi:Kef-type K+ transport system membrane component KefB